MYQEDRIEYLKRAIKRTYKRYIGERTDEKATLLDVAKFFNIPIDESRLEDYVVKKIDYKVPSIEIMDENNNISYIANYTGDSNLLNFSGPTQFNSIVSISPTRKEEKLYYIGSETPIITKMTFSDGEYELVFERQMSNSVGLFINNGVKMTVKYLQNVIYDGKNVKQPLFNRVYKKNYRNGEFDGSFEQEYTYGSPHIIKYDNTQDKYAYLKNNNVIYGINEFEKNGACTYLRGVCFENTNIDPSHYLPFNMYVQDYPMLNKNDINSAMIFRCITEDDVHHSLQIYKSNDNISIMYHSKKYFYEEEYRVEIIANEEYNLTTLSDGTISIEEIQNILTSLQEKFEDNIFIDIISTELNTFSQRIDNRKRLVEEDFDPLSPKLLINKSFEEIDALVSANKTMYFKLISEQFDMATNIDKFLGKGQTKILKPNNQKK